MLCPSLIMPICLCSASISGRAPRILHSVLQVGCNIYECNPLEPTQQRNQPTQQRLEKALSASLYYCAGRYRAGALIGACAYISTARKYALIREMRLIRNTLRQSKH